MSVSDQSLSQPQAGARPEGEVWTPGEGWREVDVWDNDAELHWYGNPPGLDVVKAWVRVPTVPPLPTVENTVIRVEWIRPAHSGSREATLFSDGWHFRDGQIDAPYVVQHNITGFEVLAEPPVPHAGHVASIRAEAKVELAREVRAEIAKDVLGRVRAIHPTPLQSIELARIARAFGVES